MATITDDWTTTFQGLPNNARSADFLASDIATPKRAVSERGRREHYWTPSSDNSKHGLHLPGSAVAFVQDAAPTTRPDGDTLDSDDIGRLWFDSNDSNIPYLRLEEAWQQLGGGMSGTIYVLGSGSADRSIQFAGDASLLWDESEDVFVFDKPVELDFGTHVTTGRIFNDYMSDITPTQNEVFDALTAYIPVNDQRMFLTGGGYVETSSSSYIITFSHATRTDANTITLYGISVIVGGTAPSFAGSTAAFGSLTCANGGGAIDVDGVALDGIRLAW